MSSEKKLIYSTDNTGKDGEGKFSKSITMPYYDKERKLLNYKCLDLYLYCFLIHSLSLDFLI